MLGKVYDGNFDRIENNYRLVDKTIRGFHANVEAYLVNLRVIKHKMMIIYTA